jgi:hypothetical protein
MAFFLLACFLMFLAVKLLLGIMLLSSARSRYKGLKERERMWTHTGAHRSSTFGTTTITKENRAIIYGGNPEEEKRVSEMVRKGCEREMRVEMETFEGEEDMVGLFLLGFVFGGRELDFFFFLLCYRQILSRTRPTTLARNIGLVPRLYY